MSASSTPPRVLTGLYFGSSETPDGERAWIVRFDGAGGRARLYAPPDNPALAPVDPPGRPGALTLRSEPGLGDVYYVFELETAADGARGAVAVMRAGRRGDSTLARVPVVLRPLAEGAAAPNGFYSSAGYDEESGDATGAELVVLAREGAGPVAVLTALDGDFVPYASTRATLAADGLRFEVRTPAGAEAYTASAVADGLVMRPAGGPAADTDTLTRRATLAQFLTGTAPR